MHTWTGQPLVNVDGTLLTLYGYTDISLHLSNLLSVSVVIADGLTTEAILGFDFWETNQCTLDMGNCTLNFPGSQPITLSLPSLLDFASPLMVSLANTIQIPAASELEIMAHVRMQNSSTSTHISKPCSKHSLNTFLCV